MQFSDFYYRYIIYRSLSKLKKGEMFNKQTILQNMEALRRPNGAFIASPSENYSSLWIRDTLYATYAYWYLGDFEKLKQGIWIVFDLFKKHKKKIKVRIASPIYVPGGLIHAKFNSNTLEEITADDKWGHHQLDALGLFLHIVADADFKNMRIIRDEEDLEILELLVAYLRSVEYWLNPDYGMWEECEIQHSSSIGAVVAGLKYVKKQKLVDIRDPLIQLGDKVLNEILPFESREQCLKSHHSHDCDSAQLSLIWPYHVTVKPEKIDEIISRIVNGHKTNGDNHKLLQIHGFNRYWGDDYFRSTEGKYRGISAEWPMFKFWLSIIYSQFHDQVSHEKAVFWFKEGCGDIKDSKIPELYQNGKQNNNTPLAWAHALALIATKYSFSEVSAY
ncbi:MAG: Major facilitator superfamily MFS [Parcubacteria group bacterium GW2011_GWA2_42_14]|nr:MAG: Major facilitator superfamily MFS [Parcubacteria group bacterium GW2011_GWA2_42_14]